MDPISGDIIPLHIAARYGLYDITPYLDRTDVINNQDYEIDQNYSVCYHGHSR